MVLQPAGDIQLALMAAVGSLVCITIVPREPHQLFDPIQVMVVEALLSTIFPVRPTVGIEDRPGCPAVANEVGRSRDCGASIPMLLHVPCALDTSLSIYSQYSFCRSSVRLIETIRHDTHYAAQSCRYGKVLGALVVSLL